MIPTLVSLLLLGPLPAADDPPVPAEAELMAEGWELVDGIASQIGEEVITWSALDGARLATDPPTEPREALENLFIPSLMAQAGEAIGLSPARIEQIVSQNQAAARSRMGSRAYAESLAESGLDPLQLWDGQTRMQNLEVWKAIQRGMIGPGGDAKRPIRDPFARPGLLRSLYRIRHMELRNALGEPEQVMFQTLIVGAADNGGIEAALERAEEILVLAQDGEDFDTLVRENSSMRDGPGLTTWIDPVLLKDIEIRTFALEAAVGDVSPPLPWVDSNTGEVIAYRLLSLHDRLEGRPPPPFHHREAQRWLRDDYGLNWRRATFNREIQELQSRTYQWVHPHPELQAPPAPGPDPGPARGGS